jgi:protein-L-isoaspartate(D-aspartate) O-methyltransferase
VVEAAFRRVPHEIFVPERLPLKVAYNADDSVAVKRDDGGVIISSVSAPFIEARMLGQAGIKPGGGVWEIGSGGYNAALIADIVGPDGLVVTVDIDPEIVRRTSMLVDVAGYGGRVLVVVRDAAGCLPEYGPFHRILVTAGAWDIAPAWLSQLAPGDGTLVVPLRINGVIRSIAFQRGGDHLISRSAEVCGFDRQRHLAHPSRIGGPNQDQRSGHDHLARTSFIRNPNR